MNGFPDMTVQIGDVPTARILREARKGLDSLAADMAASDMSRIRDRGTLEATSYVSHESVVVRMGWLTAGAAHDGWSISRDVRQPDRDDRTRRICALIRHVARMAENAERRPSIDLPLDPALAAAVALADDGRRVEWVHLPTPYSDGVLALEGDPVHMRVPEALTRGCTPSVTVEFSEIGGRPLVRVRPSIRTAPTLDLVERMRIIGRQSPETLAAAGRIADHP